MSKEYSYTIKTGTLKLIIEEGNPDSLFQVESRRNPKRGFLFVSKVLGKHIPVDINSIDSTHKKIASKILKNIDLSKKTLLIGMAETATLLGYGVYQNLLKDFKDLSYISSTRFPSEQSIAFEEAHSHAPSQFLHLEDKDYEQVILIDDELSTGNTFVGFEEVLKNNLPKLSRIVWGCLTDFRKSSVKATQKDTKDVVSLLKGEWSFEWADRPYALPASENIYSVKPKNIVKYGRYITLDHNTDYIFKDIDTYKDLQGKILVLGTGEFMPFPYSIAKKIKSDKNEVFFQATTRSPADMEGLKWDCDHYGENVNQFLYNYKREDYDHVLLFIENNNNSTSLKMAEDLGAELISLKK